MNTCTTSICVTGMGERQNPLRTLPIVISTQNNVSKTSLFSPTWDNMATCMRFPPRVKFDGIMFRHLSAVKC